MYDELTKSDLKKMQEEIDYRVQTLRPKLIEDVQTARAFGDLSENFEYKCAKQEKNRNDARVRCPCSVPWTAACFLKKRERQTWEMRCPSSKRRAAP